MKIKKFLVAALAAAVCAGMTAFVSAEADDYIDEEEIAAMFEHIKRGEGYYEYFVVDYMPGFVDEEGTEYCFETFGSGYSKDMTAEEIERQIAENLTNDIISLKKNPDDYDFSVHIYKFDDYDYTAGEFYDFVRNEQKAFDDDTPKYYPLEENDDTLVEDEAEAIYDEPHKGEGYYICRISFHNGAPEIHDENGDIYAIWDEEGGYMQEGETREDIENAVAESMREQLASIGANPNDYGFDVYAYFYDDYNFTSEEFFDFVNEDILRRDSERDTPTVNVPNPVTGAGLPCSAAVLTALSAVGIFAVNKKKSL